MAKKADRIAVNEIEKIVKAQEDVKEVEWNGLKLKIKKYLPFEDMRVYVNGVVSACFNQDGSYQPEVKDFVRRALTVSLYTNISLPKNLNAQYDVVYGTDIVDIIYNHIDWQQHDEMSWAIDDRIGQLLKADVAALNKQKAELEETATKIQEMFEGIDPQDIENMVSALTNMDITEEGLMQAYLKSKTDEPTNIN